MNINSRIKRIIKTIEIRMLNFLSCFFQKKKEVIFESNPDFACNTFAVYNEILKHNIFDSYRFTWLISKESQIPKDIQNRCDFIFRDEKSFIYRIKNYIRCNRAEIVICCNRHISNKTTRKNQLNIYLGHGSPLKLLKSHGKPDYKECKYLVSQSDFFNPIMADQFSIDINKIVTLGVPRNDELFSTDVNLCRLGIDKSQYKKIIIWVPTFREHKEKTRIDSHSNFPFGLPLFRTIDDVNKLNLYLISVNVLIIIKPHPAQDLDVIRDMKCSNIYFLFDDVMISNGLQTNEVLSVTDAMITDYSGIYYDYLLLDRPIAISLDDYEIYRSEKGFCYSNPLELLRGFYLYNIDDLVCFIQSVLNEDDPLLEERKKIKLLTNKYCDNHSSERVVDFIIKKMN